MKQFLAVLEEPEACVAVNAEQSPYAPARLMFMVNGKTNFGLVSANVFRCAADGASASLSFKHLVVVSLRDAVFGLHCMLVYKLFAFWSRIFVAPMGRTTNTTPRALPIAASVFVPNQIKLGDWFSDLALRATEFGGKWLCRAAAFVRRIALHHNSLGLVPGHGCCNQRVAISFPL
jgi:hypothetical protein